MIRVWRSRDAEQLSKRVIDWLSIGAKNEYMMACELIANLCEHSQLGERRSGCILVLVYHLVISLNIAHAIRCKV